MKVVIIEDELPAAQRLERLVKALRPDWSVVGTADSIEDAVEDLDETKPDLAFMDIQLADGQSFKIFEKTDVPCPVIFTTAHDEYAIQAFKVNSIDYLLKPIDEEQLEQAMQKFESQQQGAQLPDLKALMQEFRSNVSYKKRFLIRSGQRLSFVPTTDIHWFVSEASSTFLVTATNERFLIDQTLDELEGELNPEQFFRINRKFIVTIDCISKIENYFNNRLLLEVAPEASEEVIVSRQRVKEFKSWIDS
ncbi:LytR/AlgR family response regulator transcription factor [Sanyastnella coralliicola]|uniref:LytR/AlgR family response regulator transcription factor n=1 Tax=Sanyastnella coralliicola TaxID=3069118 RepID=UPI0027B95E7B|nr:LytTR family DNA-binding domain-containing protein [Longitalea sp. SCSIO 12813]